MDISDKEDGECSFDEIDDIEIEQPKRLEECKLESNHQIKAKALKEKAKYLRIMIENEDSVVQEKIDQLYKTLQRQENERHILFDTIHIQGIENLKTEKIFQYLKDCQPVSVEWTSTSSCNVTFQDHLAAALALLIHSRELKDDAMEICEWSNIHMRVGFPHLKHETIFFRFATKNDLKPLHNQKEILSDQPAKKFGKDPWSNLSKNWGVHDHQETFVSNVPSKNFVFTKNGIIKKNRIDALDNNSETLESKPITKSLKDRLGIRRPQLTETLDDSDDEKWKERSKVPRMRMHADDEEKRNPKLRNRQRDDNIYEERVIRSSCVRERLGKKVDKDNETLSDSSIEPERRAQKSSVWQRLEAKSDNASSLKSSVQKNDDYRSKSPLKIEIDNDYYDSSSSSSSSSSSESTSSSSSSDDSS